MFTSRLLALLTALIATIVALEAGFGDPLLVSVLFGFCCLIIVYTSSRASAEGVREGPIKRDLFLDRYGELLLGFSPILAVSAIVLAAKSLFGALRVDGETATVASVQVWIGFTTLLWLFEVGAAAVESLGTLFRHLLHRRPRGGLRG